MSKQHTTLYLEINRVFCYILFHSQDHPGRQPTSFQALPLPSCVILGKLHSLSVPVPSYVPGIKRITRWTAKQCLDHWQCSVNTMYTYSYYHSCCCILGASQVLFSKKARFPKLEVFLFNCENIPRALQVCSFHYCLVVYILSCTLCPTQALLTLPSVISCLLTTLHFLSCLLLN